MKFSLLLVAVLPALCAAGFIDYIKLIPRHGSVALAKQLMARYVRDTKRELVERARSPFLVKRACNAADIISGLKRIEASVSRLSSNARNLPKATTGTCPKLNLQSLLNDQELFTTRLKSEIASVRTCSLILGDRSVIRTELSSVLLPLASGLSSQIVAASSVICCNGIGSIGRGQATSVSSLILGYASALGVNGACRSILSPYRNSFTSLVTACIRTISC